MHSKDKVSLIKIAVTDLPVLRSLVIIGVLCDTGEEKPAQLRTSDVAITVGICITTDSIDKLLPKNTLIRHSFIGRARGDVLANWFCGVAGNLLRYSPRESEEFTTEAGIK